MARAWTGVIGFLHWLLATLPGAPARTAASARWLMSAEQLPPPPDEPLAARPRTPRLLSWLFGGELLDTADAPSATPQRGALRSVLSAEELPESPDQPRAAGEPPRCFWRWVFSGDQLPEPDAPQTPTIRRTRFLHRVLATEECPQNAPLSPQSGDRYLRWVLSPETCPQEEGLPPRRGSGFLRWISSPDVCPQDASPPTGSRKGFLRWLLAREQF